jgi:hypothetical protein
MYGKWEVILRISGRNYKGNWKVNGIVTEDRELFHLCKGSE